MKCSQCGVFTHGICACRGADLPVDVSRFTAAVELWVEDEIVEAELVWEEENELVELSPSVIGFFRIMGIDLES